MAAQGGRLRLSEQGSGERFGWGHTKTQARGAAAGPLWVRASTCRSGIRCQQRSKQTGTEHTLEAPMLMIMISGRAGLTGRKSIWKPVSSAGQDTRQARTEKNGAVGGIAGACQLASNRSFKGHCAKLPVGLQPVRGTMNIKCMQMAREQYERHSRMPTPPVYIGGRTCTRTDSGGPPTIINMGGAGWSAHVLAPDMRL